MEQVPLFERPAPIPSHLPAGLVYEPGFLSAGEEAGLIDLVRALPLAPARYKGYTARRRVLSYCGVFDYDSNELHAAAPLIDALHPLRDRVAAWAGLPADSLLHALVAEYAPGTPLGWHRDVPAFEQVIGVSLGSDAVLRFRPWPLQPHRRADVLHLCVAARSAYRLQGEARWAWQHSVPPVKELRWSITFRTRSGGGQTRRNGR